MADELPPLDPGAPEPPPRVIVRRSFVRSGAMAALKTLIVAAVLAVAAVFVIDSSIGHRFLVDRITALVPVSGLRVSIGRIDGSVYGAATIHDLTLSDPKGPFLVVPVSELDWRPLSWVRSGLDIRALTMHRGHLLRAPALKPGKPGGSTLPNFDIRIDKLVLDAFIVDAGVIGERRRIDLTGRADVRKGRALVDLDGRLGGKDRLVAHLDSEPDRDKFELAADYNAPRDGLLATLTGTHADVMAKVGGKGGWRDWRGFAVAQRGGKPLAALQLGNRSGRYSVAGLVHPGDLVTGLPARALGETVGLVFGGTFLGNVIEGRLAAQSQALHAVATGALDLGQDRARGLLIDAVLDKPQLLLPDPALTGVRLNAKLDGPFSALAIEHRLTVVSLHSGQVEIDGLAQQGTARLANGRLTVPLALTAQRVLTGNPSFDPRLVNGRAGGTLVLNGTKLDSDAVDVAFPGLTAHLALRSDLARGTYALAGPVDAKGLALTNLGLIDANAKIVFSMADRSPWRLQAQANGAMTRIDNATLESLTGGGVRFAGNATLGLGAPIVFRDTRLTSRKLSLMLSGARAPDGRTTLAGNGRSTDYGPFTVRATLAQNGPQAELVFADPLPAASLKDVRVALSPIKDGFRIETAGGSRLGPFAGTLGLFIQPRGATQVRIETLKVSQTSVSGALTIAGWAATGKLALTGGGLDGTIALANAFGGQGIDALINARNATFAGATPIRIGKAQVEAKGVIATGHSNIDATLYAEGLSSGRLFIGRIAAHTALTNGAGPFTASMAGRRGARFALQTTGSIASDRVVLLASGDYAGRPISMARRAVLTRDPNGSGWSLAPTQVNFAGGIAIASGHLLGRPTQISLQLAKMPLSLADIAVGDLGLGGSVSGIVDYRNDGQGAPTGNARVMINGLTRSGLILSSSPIDVALIAALDAQTLQTRAVFKEGGAIRGRLQGRIANLPRGGTLVERIRAGSLAAQLRYSGAADALWRLAGVDTFDLTGPLGVTADISGNLDNPVIRGALASNALRLQSALTGTDLRNIKTVGTFDGSVLTLPRFAGTTPNGGTVVGNGTIDLSDVASRGVALDLKIAAANAQVLNRDDIKATVTGPLRLVSNGNGGTIAGRLRIDKGSWALGRAAAAAAIPVLKTREINLPSDVAPPPTPTAPWTYLIDAVAPGQFNVRGLGLDSDWSADVRLRGPTSNPQIFGTADVQRGSYQFSGKSFDLTRGKIRFTGEQPPDPRLDIAAAGDANGVSATITIQGSASKPEISFTSIPALPEEELLSRLLFGSSITQISAPEAVQLAAAVASLRGGSGLDPINKLRKAIGLDRLRVIGADATTGRGTAIAVGKYLGRRFFVELVTDGRGYSATSIEFRITRWLALLGTVSSMAGEQSLNLKASKDY
jgi:translocation and assembly module TamB